MSANKKIVVFEGAEACAEGAMFAGVDFFAGYPITPSSEIPAIMSLKLPQLSDGVFIQMEDEGASIAAIIGASLAGRKVMTATSGPGFSIMQELLGYACMTEVPMVVVNVQRGGPSTGLPTQVAQADIMQAKWGTHGDHSLITLCPDTVEDTFYTTIRAVNLAEKYRVPVVILMDEILAHTKENMTLPRKKDVDVVQRRYAAKDEKDFQPFDKKHGLVPPMVDYNGPLHSLSTGLLHNEKGYFTTASEDVIHSLDRLRDKIDKNLDDIILVENYQTEDCDRLFISCGTSARACGSAVNYLRSAGVKAGLLNLKTIWPFPEKAVESAINRAKEVFVVEMNQGQLIHEVRKLAADKEKITPILKYDGYVITPEYIMNVTGREK